MHFTIERTIHAPRERVYDAMTDLNRWSDTIEAIQKVEPAEPDATLEFADGVAFKETRTMFGKEATETMTVRDVVPNESWALTAHSCGADHRYDYTLSDTPEGGTRVTLTGDVKGAKLVAKVLGAVMGPLMKGTMLKCMQKDFDDIERAVATRQ